MNKKVNVIITICGIFSLLYIFLAVHPLSKELHFKTVWTSDSTRPSTLNPETVIKSEDYIPFRLGQTAGYFTADGLITSVFTFPYKAAVDKDEYALYSTSGNSIQIYTNKGEKAGLISSAGFPFFQNGRKFLMLPGGNSFSSLNEDGSINFTYENYCPITAFSSSKSSVAAGFADGSVIIFDNDGKIDQRFIPGGSAYNVILGAAVSDSGRLSACVSGHDRQRFVLARKENSITKIIFHEFLKSDTSRQLTVKFSGDEAKCFFEYEDGLGIVDTKNLKISHISIDGDILSIQEAPEVNTVFVLSKKDKKYSVHVIEKFDKYAGCFSFEANNSFITVKDSSLFVGRDSSISKIEISHK